MGMNRTHRLAHSCLASPNTLYYSQRTSTAVMILIERRPPGMPQPAAPVPMFCSFAPEDEPLCLELERRLKHLQRQGLLTLWHRGHIPTGTDQASTVTVALKRAALILLLISPDYLASDDCYDVELAHAMQRYEAGTARVI